MHIFDLTNQPYDAIIAVRARQLPDQSYIDKYINTTAKEVVWEMLMKSYNKFVAPKLRPLKRSYLETVLIDTQSKFDPQFEELVESLFILHYGLRIFKNPLIYVHSGHKGVFTKDGKETDLTPYDVYQLATVIPYVGHIQGLHVRKHEANSFHNDLTWKELNPFFKRHIDLVMVSSPKEAYDYLTAALGKYPHGIVPKFIHEDKVYPVRPLRSTQDIQEWVNYDPYIFAHEESLPLAIQEALDLTHETRFFITNGNTMTFSATKPELTPLDLVNPEPLGPNDIWLFEQPHDYLVDMLEFIPQITKTLADANHVKTNTYVIDLAYDKRSNQVCLVELNAIHNSGLYASRPDLLVLAAKDNPDDFKLHTPVFKETFL